MDRGRGREIELALLLSIPRMREREVQAARTLMSDVLDWSLVFGTLIVHRTAGVAWQNIADHGLQRAFRPLFILRQMELLYQGQRLLAEDQTALVAELFREFDRCGITCALLKGAAVARMGYRAPGMRVYNDSDLLFHPASLADVGQVMRKFGYIQGYWDATSRRVVPAERSQILLHSVTSHETFPYAKPTPDAAILDQHVVDVHFSVNLLRNTRVDDVVRSLLDRRIRLAGTNLWALHQEDMFVFVCVHFQREACNRREVEETKDLVLYKLVDLLAMLESVEYSVDLDAVVRRAHESGFAREVYFSLIYLDALFPDRVPAGILEALRPESVAYLDQIFFDEKPIHTWRRPIRERFFDSHRQLELREPERVIGSV